MPTIMPAAQQAKGQLTATRSAGLPPRADSTGSQWKSKRSLRVEEEQGSCGYLVRKGGASQGALNKPGMRRLDCEMKQFRQSSVSLGVGQQSVGNKTNHFLGEIPLCKLPNRSFVKGTAHIDSFFHSTSMPVHKYHSHELSRSDASQNIKPKR